MAQQIEYMSLNTNDWIDLKIDTKNCILYLSMRGDRIN